MTKRAALSLRTALLISLTMGLSWFPVAWADLNDGLVAYYPFNGNADDESGNSNHGMVNGATLTEDKFGNAESAYSFNGINNYINLGNVIATNVFSFSVWFTTNSSKRNQTILGNYRPCSYVDTGFILLNYGREIEKGDPRLQLYKKTAIEYSEDMADNRWHHVVGVFGKNSFYFYVDGILRGSETGSYNQTSINTKVGAADAISDYCGVTGESYFNGKIDNIRIYSRTLSESEVQQLYQIGGSSLQFSATNYNVNEGDGSATITVTRSENNDGAISVDYATSDNTAIAGSDYTQTSGTINWNDGDDADKTFTIDIIDDSAQESDERLIVSLGNPTGGAQLGSPNTAIVTIIDNDSAFSCKKVSEIQKNECNALVALYDSTKGENWENNSGWKVTNSPCSWNGVSCLGGHVTELSLVNNNLKGSISKKFFKLKQLKKLDLSDNEIDRSILKYVNKFKKLNSLLLNNCLK
jgi:hypothetical protein